MKALKMAVVFGECGRECLSGPGNTEVFSVLAGRGGGQNRFQKAGGDTHTPDRQQQRGVGGQLNSTVCVSANIISEPLIFAIQRTGALLNCN